MLVNPARHAVRLKKDKELVGQIRRMEEAESFSVARLDGYLRAGPRNAPRDDKRVNLVTPGLFREVPNPARFRGR